ncbi:MAG: O-antigen ligase family protein [Chloroherpetonaceae bacterium]|nr:O-antigen ligase family protein [Chloroherpetonaceae bacterium]
MESLLKAFVVVATLFAAISFLDDAVRRDFSRYNSGISFLLVPAALIVIAALFTEGMRTARSALILVLLILLAGILITFTRGLYLGFLLGCVAIAVAMGLRRSMKAMLWLGAMGLLALGLMLALGLSLGKIIVLTTSRGEAVVGDLDVSSVERILEILAVLDEFPRHPLFGVGAGGTLTVYRFGDANVDEGMVDWWFIHNNYAHVLHKGGLIGLFALLVLWLGALVQAYRLYRLAISPQAKTILLALIGSLVGFMTIGLVTPVMTYINTNFFNALMFASLAYLERQILPNTATQR